MATAAEVYPITNGPGKWKLALATYEPSIKVEFTFKEGSRIKKVWVSISEVKIADEARNKFCFLAESDNFSITNGWVAKVLVSIEYNIEKKEGHLTIIER